MEYWHAFSSELLKIRRTWAFTLSIAAPAGVVLFIFVIVLQADNGTWKDVWIFYLRGIIWSWLAMMLPLYVALLMAVLAYADHKSDAWKVLLAQPISRPPIYAAKLAVGILLVTWSYAVLAICCLGTAALLPKLRPRLGDYTAGLQVSHVLVMLAAAWAATSLIVALHAWLSVRSANFALSLGVAIFAEIPNVLGLHEERLQKFWPWLYPFDAVRIIGLQSRDEMQHFWSAGHLLLVSLCAAALVTAIAIWDFNRREIVS